MDEEKLRSELERSTLVLGRLSHIKGEKPVHRSIRCNRGVQRASREEKIAQVLCKPSLRNNIHVDHSRIYAYHRFTHPSYRRRIFEEKQEIFSLESPDDVARMKRIADSSGFRVV